MEAIGSLFWNGAGTDTAPPRPLRLALARDVEHTSVHDAIRDIAGGGMVVVATGDGSTGSSGSLVMAAECVSARDVNFMIRQAGGWICLGVTSERFEQLGLRRLPGGGESAGARYAATVDARHGVPTGMSAAEQAQTMRTVAAPDTGRDDLVSPGHVRVLDTHPGGVLGRAAVLEASADLARLGGRTPAGVTCAVQGPDGSTARMPQLAAFCRDHGLKLVTLADLLAHRRRHEPRVERVVATAMPTRHGVFTAYGYRSLVDHHPYVAMVKGEVAGKEDVLVRVHRRCLAGDVFRALGCTCGRRLSAALEAIEDHGEGVLLYVAEGADGLGAVDDPDGRRPPLDPAAGAQILIDLGLRSARILADAPQAAGCLAAPVPGPAAPRAPWDAGAFREVLQAG